MYKNEAEVCQAVHAFTSGKLPNEGTGKVWLTTKVAGNEHGEGVTEKAVDESVATAEKYGLSWVRFQTFFSSTFPPACEGGC